MKEKEKLTLLIAGGRNTYRRVFRLGQLTEKTMKTSTKFLKVISWKSELQKISSSHQHDLSEIGVFTRW